MVPLSVAVLEWWSELLGLVVLGYAFVKAATQALHLYHCTRNPEAFERLKAENFRHQKIERIKAEALALKAQTRNVTSDF